MFTAEWDWIAAERSFQRALAINPNHAEAYIYYGVLMEALGDLERGLHLKLQGLECDSTSALAHVWIAVSFWNQRRYDDVIVWANKALDRDPQHPFARELLMGAHWKMGDLARAGELPPHGAAQSRTGMVARASLRRGWRPRRGLRASSPRNRRARPCVASSRRGASVGLLACGSALQHVSRPDETAAARAVSGPLRLARRVPVDLLAAPRSTVHNLAGFGDLGWRGCQRDAQLAQ